MKLQYLRRLRIKISVKKRVELIRLGNQAFKQGDFAQASKIFKTVHYQDGLIRLGDHYYYTKHQPLMAYGYYRLAKHNKMLDKISDGFVFALRCWLDPKKAAKQMNEQIELNKPKGPSIK